MKECCCCCSIPARNPSKLCPDTIVLMCCMVRIVLHRVRACTGARTMRIMHKCQRCLFTVCDDCQVHHSARCQNLNSRTLRRATRTESGTSTFSGERPFLRACNQIFAFVIQTTCRHGTSQHSCRRLHKPSLVNVILSQRTLGWACREVLGASTFFFLVAN